MLPILKRKVLTMRKFLAALMAVFMLTAALAVLPASAAVTTSDKDGSTTATADEMDLVITEVLADTQSNNIGKQTLDAFQYIEIYNRGDAPVNLYDYAIVRAKYNEKSGTPWADPKKFEGKIVLDPGSIYAYWQTQNVPNISTYAQDQNTYGCANPADGTLNPGEVAIIWIWNDSTKQVFGLNGGTTGEKEGNFVAFRNHYKDQGAEIPANAKIFASFGVDGIGQSFHLNVTGSYIYALVQDVDNGFDVSTEVAYKKTTGGNYETCDKVVAMFKHGTALGWYKPTENKSVIYTLASKTPHYNNAYYENEDTNYFEAGVVDSFKEMACIWYEEAMTPGKLLPIQWADLAPTNPNAPADGAAAWNTYVTALVAANGGGETEGREEEDKHQDQIDVDRDDLGNQGQNKLGEWTYVEVVDEVTGEVTYWRYKTEDGSMDTAVQIDKAQYDLAQEAMAAANQKKDGGLGVGTWIIIGVCAAVVAAAVTVGVIFILKKKNKNVALDDVAGDVQIIDEDKSEQ